MKRNMKNMVDIFGFSFEIDLFLKTTKQQRFIYLLLLQNEIEPMGLILHGKSKHNYNKIFKFEKKKKFPFGKPNLRESREILKATKNLLRFNYQVP